MDNNNHKIRRGLIFTAIIILIFIFPFILMYVLRKLLDVGVPLEKLLNISILEIGTTTQISLGDYYYFYSQLLNVMLTAFFSAILLYFATKDYVENHIKKLELDFDIANLLYIVSTEEEIFMHVPITFVNRSKRLGYISEVNFEILDSKENVISELEPTFFVYINNNYKVNNFNEDTIYVENDTTYYSDGLPFVNIPIKGEEAIREFITFSQKKKCAAVELFKNLNCYSIKITLHNELNPKNRIIKSYKFTVDDETHNWFQNTCNKKIHGNRRIIKIKKIKI